MAIMLNVEAAYEFAVRAPYDETFALLADVPLSASHCPRVAQVEAAGRKTWRWHMDPVGLGQVQVQTVYTCKYSTSGARGRIEWTPVTDDPLSNAEVSGHWALRQHEGHTALVLDIRLAQALELPAMAKLLIEPLLQAEFEQLIEGYIERLIEALGGEVEI